MSGKWEKLSQSYKFIFVFSGIRSQIEFFTEASGNDIEIEVQARNESLRQNKQKKG